MTRRSQTIQKAIAIADEAMKKAIVDGDHDHHDRLRNTREYLVTRSSELETDPIDIRDISHVAQFGGMAR